VSDFLSSFQEALEEVRKKGTFPPPGSYPAPRLKQASKKRGGFREVKYPN
jgi:hypothetical protein